MAGTKEKPCRRCKYDDFEVGMEKFRKDKIDICFLCQKASEWTERYNHPLHRDPKKPGR